MISLELSNHPNTSGRFFSFLMLVVGISSLLFAVSCPAPGPDEITAEIDSTELKETSILPAFESPLPKSVNAIWCSSIQVAWDKLTTDLAGEPIRLEGAEEVVELLNNSRANADDLAPESYFATAGRLTEEFINGLRDGLRAKFPEKSPPDLRPSGNILAYAYLEILLKFGNPYFILEDGLFFTDSRGNGTPVKGFGVDKESRDAAEVRNQVGVLFYYVDTENPDVKEFAADLDTASETYQVVAAMVQPKDSLAATFDYIQTRAAEYPGGEEYRRFRYQDELKVPEMAWKISHRFKELEEKTFLNESLSDQSIDTALQIIEFKLNREGVELKSEVFLKGDTAMKPSEDVRKLLFDRPFLIYIKKRDAATPVFAMWVDNAELLKETD
jgi:hypothetical protein